MALGHPQGAVAKQQPDAALDQSITITIPPAEGNCLLIRPINATKFCI
jgi:hypothetical protein